MEDLIKRTDAIKAEADRVYKALHSEGCKETYEECLADAEKTFKDVPSAEPKQGEWIITEQDNGHKWTHRKCSECGKGIIEPLGVSGMKFCPNCGARMVK